MRRWLATKLWPEFDRAERRYWYLWHQVDDVNKWCDGEARDVTRWLLDQDADHWRPLDAPVGARATPWGIQEFREWVYKKRAARDVREPRELIDRDPDHGQYLPTRS